MKLAVIGHVEHITIGRVPAVPRAGEIAHLEDPRALPGGGGGIAFYQLAKSQAEVHLFTAIGSDEAGAFVEKRVRETGAKIHVARRDEPHTRDVVMIGPERERTIVVVGQPLHPRASDPLPWHILADLDAVYYTAQDPDLIRMAREARILAATARRRPSIILSGARLDAIIGSKSDTREISTLADYPVPPSVLVMTEGERGGEIATSAGIVRFTAPTIATTAGGSYGAGDSFAAAFTYYLALGLTPQEAAQRAAHHGAAVLQNIDPLQAQRPL